MAGVGGGNTSSATEKRFLFFSSHVADQTAQSIMSQVDQYHEEAGGQRTVVRLGEFQR